MEWILILGLLGWPGALWCGVLWQRERRHTAARRQMWRNVLQTLRDCDHDGATALTAMLESYPGAAELMDDARATLRAIQTRHAELQRGRRDLEDVLSSLQDAVLVVDQEARLRFLNAAAEQLFEVRVQDVLGAHLLEALPTFALEAGVRAALEENRHHAREVSLYVPRVREALLRVAPMRRSQGGVGEAGAGGAVVILQDLTELRRLERVRRDFVANASHELRTPVANIRATAETMLEHPDDVAMARRFLPRLVSEAERLARLVSDLLHLARAEAPGERTRETVELSALAAEVQEQLRAKAEQRHIALRSELTGAARVCGDRAGLEQVVFNLLDNALMYTPAGGSITLQTASPAASSTSTSSTSTSSVTLTVSDTGIGIPAGELPRIFERFYRVDKARSRAQGGTGLGLAIVRHIVENHGGHIRVESEEGVGTTFTVTLPAAGLDTGS